MASMPGYELTEPWLTEDGLPKKGIWDVVYYAGEGKCKNGCKPMPKLRRSLLQLVSGALQCLSHFFVVYCFCGTSLSLCVKYETTHPSVSRRFAFLC